MPQFSLRLEIDGKSLATIREAGEQLVVVKSPTGLSSQVVWVSVLPFIENQISWEEEYALYARQTQDVSVKIVRMVTTEFPTLSGTAFELDESFGFKPTKDEFFPPAGTYRVFNQANQPATSDLRFGLEQPVVVNGQASAERINAELVPNQQLADFSPKSAVVVWLQSNVAVGDLVSIPPAVGASISAASKSTVMSRSTKIEFGGGVADASYSYDPSVGGFVPSS